MLAALQKESGKKYAPPMALWTMEAELIAALIDELKRNTYYTIVAGGAKNAPKPEQYPRPRTAIAKATWENRQAKHNALAARMLPHKRK